MVAGDKISDEIKKIIEKAVPALVQWWSERPLKRATSAAASLAFWPDGMLEQLQLISKGQATQSDFVKLRSHFRESKGPVREIIEGLRDSRDKILKCRGGPQVVEVINEIIYGPVGKLTIRSEIEAILKKAKSPTGETAAEALMVCNQIEAFNASLNRLHRLVYGL